jgi:SAM-dependent methyltransferase
MAIRRSGMASLGPTLDEWLNPATETMLEMARIGPGGCVLDVAAGAGGQTLLAAVRVGPSGSILATDISSNILEFAAEETRRHGLANVTTQVADGENLEVEPHSFDAVISRIGLIYFPDQQAALRSMLRALKPGGRLAAIVYSTADKNGFFSVPVSIIRNRAKLPPPVPGQPGPFSLGGDGILRKALETAGFSRRRGARHPGTIANEIRGGVSALRTRVVRRSAPDAVGT